MATHVYSCPVRWSDVDLYGVVNNVAYLRLLEEARVDLVWRIGSRDRMENDAFFHGGSVVVNHHIEYRRPLFYSYENIDIELWVSNLKYSQVTIEYVIKDKATTFALASTTMAPYSYSKKHPRRLSDEEISFFSDFYHPGIGAGCRSAETITVQTTARCANGG